MLGVVDVGWGLESEKTVLVEVEAVTIDIQVPVAPGGHEEIVFVRVGLVVKDAVRVVDLAEILVGAVLAGGVDLFEAALEQIAGGLVGFYELFNRHVGVDVRGVPVDPVGFERWVVPMVEWLLEVGDGSEYAVENHAASDDAVACPDGGVF